MPDRQPIGLGLHIKTTEGENTFLFLTPLSCRLKVTALNTVSPTTLVPLLPFQHLLPRYPREQAPDQPPPGQRPQTEEESLTNATAPPMFPQLTGKPGPQESSGPPSSLTST